MLYWHCVQPTLGDLQIVEGPVHEAHGHLAVGQHVDVLGALVLRRGVDLLEADLDLLGPLPPLFEDGVGDLEGRAHVVAEPFGQRRL